MSRIISFYVLIGIIVVIGILVYRVLATFVLPLFLAGLLVVMFRPLYDRIAEWCESRRRLAAALTTSAILFIALAPGALIVSLAAIESSAVMRQLDQAKIYVGLTKLRERLGLAMPNVEQWQAADTTLQSLFEELATPALDTPPTLTEQLQRWFNSQPVVTHNERNRLLELFSAQIKDLRAKLEESDDESAPGAVLLASIEKERETPAEETAEYRNNLRSIQIHYKRFKDSQLGGPYRVTVLEICNPTDEKLKELSAQGMSLLLSQKSFQIGADFAGMIVQVILVLVITVIATYFFFLDGPSMVETLMRLSPLDDRYEHELIEEFDRVSRAVVLATLLSAVAQGLLAGIGYWFAGLESVFLLILLTTFMALIPFIGATSIWLPASLWIYFYEERTFAAVALVIYGAAVVSTIDNLIKPLILHGQSNLHPLLALLSVLGGVQALGPIGILVGPMVVVFLSTLLNILHREIMSFEAHAEAASSGDNGDEPPGSAESDPGPDQPAPGDPQSEGGASLATES